MSMTAKIKERAEELLETARIHASLNSYEFDGPNFPTFATQHYGNIIRGLIAGDELESPSERWRGCISLLIVAILAWRYARQRDGDLADKDQPTAAEDDDAFEEWTQGIPDHIETLREKCPSPEGLFTALVIRNTDEQRYIDQVDEISPETTNAALRRWATDVAAIAVRLAEEGDPLVDRMGDNQGVAWILNPPRGQAE